ncbi:MAG: hypothetical protein ABSC03_01615 [Verrucomicrobiota bacterium]|jgi:hypothetical protein
MARKNKKGHNRQKPPPTQAAPLGPQRRGILRRIAGLLSPTRLLCASVSLILTLVGSYYLLRPQITVEPDSAIDPTELMNTPFRITNSGQTPIYGLIRRCFIRHLDAAGGHVNWYGPGIAVVDSYPAIPELVPGESTSLSNPVRIMKIENADIEVVLDYTAAIIPIHQQRHFRFVTKHGPNGEIMWFHKSLSE